MSGAGREKATEFLSARLQDEPEVIALWLAGSDAHDRADELSDVDLHAIVEKGANPTDIFERATEACALTLGLRWVWRVPEPTWHGHAQLFIEVGEQHDEAGVLVDLTLMYAESDNYYLEPERHGHPVILFEKRPVIQTPPPNAADWRMRLTEALTLESGRLHLGAKIIRRECQRGRLLDALGFYHSHALRPICVALGARYRPWRYDFGLRYLSLDLPPSAMRRLERAATVATIPEILAGLDELSAWFEELVETTDISSIPLEELAEAARRAAGS